MAMAETDVARTFRKKIIFNVMQLADWQTGFNLWLSWSLAIAV
jgi:hypothetical protein